LCGERGRGRGGEDGVDALQENVGAMAVPGLPPKRRSPSTVG